MSHVAIWLGWLTVMTWPALAGFAVEPPAGENAQAPDLFEDQPTPLVAKIPRSDVEQDRVQAAALFALGRMRQQRNDRAGALQSYERAYRYDPDSVSILGEVVPLAFQLKRNGEAARYAVISAEKNPTDPAFLRQLATLLAAQKDWTRALKLYEKAIQLQDEAKPSESMVRMRLEMGRLYFLTEQHAKAADAFSFFRDALANPEQFSLDAASQKKLLGNADRTYSFLGDAFLEAGRLDEAAEMYRKANDVKASEGLLALRMARIAAKDNRHQDATDKLQVYFDAKLSVAGTAPYELLRQVLLDPSQNPAEAQRRLQAELETLYEADPSNLPLGYYLASRYRESSVLAKAEKTYLELIKAQPTIEGYQALLDIYHRGGQIERLLEILGQAVLRTNSNTLEPLGKEAKAIAADAQLLDRLIAAARQKRKDDPKSLDPGKALAVGFLAIWGNRLDAAEEFLTAAAGAGSLQKPDVLRSWGLELFMAEHYQQAANVFQQAIDGPVSPEGIPDFYFFLAGALEMAGKTDDALAAGKKAAALRRGSPRFQSRVPWILYHARRYEQAKESYRELVEKYNADYNTPATREVVRDAKLVLSNIGVIQNDLPTAEEWLEQVLDEFPEDIGASNDLGYLWADQGKHLVRSLEMVRRAVDGEPDNVAYRDSLGWALFHLKRYQEAVEELQKAAAGDNPDGVILDHLGDAYLNIDDRAKAIQMWQKAKTLFEQQKDTEKVEATEAKIKKHTSQ